MDEFEKYLIIANTKKCLSLEVFLNFYDIPMRLFISLMDQSQTRYKDLEEYLSKIPSREWLTYCFQWRLADPDIVYTGYTWYEIKSEWYKATHHYKYQSKVEICFFKPIQNIPKLRLIFEGD